MISQTSHPNAASDPTFRKTVLIDASPLRVWSALTDPDQMRDWMFSSPIEVSTDWAVGGPLRISGDLHGLPFTNTGVVLAYQPVTLLRYSHLSSVSRLPDVADSHAEIEFRLAPGGDGTILTVLVTHCPTDVILKHLTFYWTVTLDVLARRLGDVAAPGG